MDTAFFSSGTEPERQPGGSPSLSPGLEDRGEKKGKPTPRRRRLFDGKPMVGDGWSPVAENAGWLLQAAPPSPDSEWRSLKLSSKVARPFSANYWLAWNGSRCAENTELQRLRDLAPETAEWAILTLEAFGV